MDSVAITIGNTIFLHNVGKASFLKDEVWVKHEMKHVEQFKRFGFVNFIVRYLWESCRVGYYHNKYEVEARLAEE